MELQSQLPALQARGLGLVAVSYDSPEVLADFSRRRGITFPLLSDPGSVVIRQYGLLNKYTEKGSPYDGIPYPGTFTLDARGVVTARFFEERYQERNTVGSILVRAQGASGVLDATATTTAHLTLAASASDQLLAPGRRTSLIVDVLPKAKMHVYAPGAVDYQPISLTINPQPGLTIRELVYPPSEVYFFEALNERVPVYSKPFRLVQDIALDASQDSQARFKTMEKLTLTGLVTYQACDDAVCYVPVKVPVAWTFSLRALDTERVKK